MKGILWAVPTAWVESNDQKFSTIPHIHCTMACGVDRADVEGCLGFEFTATITGYAIGESAECLLLSLPSDIPFIGTVPHITLSHAPEVGPIVPFIMVEAGLCTITSWEPAWPIVMRIEFLEWKERCKMV